MDDLCFLITKYAFFEYMKQPPRDFHETGLFLTYFLTFLPLQLRDRGLNGLNGMEWVFCAEQLALTNISQSDEYLDAFSGQDSGSQLTIL